MNSSNLDSTYILHSPVDMKSALFQLMTLCQKGKKSLSEPMMTKISAAI